MLRVRSVAFCHQFLPTTTNDLIISGYRRQFLSLRDFLKQEFGNLISIEDKMDRGITGNFEVIVVTKSNEKVIHSKRKGMGRAESRSVFHC